MGAAKEFKSQILYNYKKPWTFTRNYPKTSKNGNGVKKGEVPYGGIGSIEKDGEGGAQDEDEQSKVVKE